MTSNFWELFDLSSEGGSVSRSCINLQFVSAAGLEVNPDLHECLQEAAMLAAEAAMLQGEPFIIPVEKKQTGGHRIDLSFRPAATDHLQRNAVAGAGAGAALESTVTVLERGR